MICTLMKAGVKSPLLLYCCWFLPLVLLIFALYILVFLVECWMTLLSLYNDAFLCFSYNLCVKVYLVWNKHTTPGFCFNLHAVSFSTSSFCVSPYLWSESLEGSIEMSVIFIYSATVCLSIREFSPFTIKILLIAHIYCHFVCFLLAVFIVLLFLSSFSPLPGVLITSIALCLDSFLIFFSVFAISFSFVVTGEIHIKYSMYTTVYFH